MSIKNKMTNIKIVKEKDLAAIRKTKKKIILAHGTFDFFHYGHLRHLKKAKKKADILVVSLTADKFIRKGPGRPIYDQNKRAEIMSSLDFVDHVIIVNSFSGIEIIKLLKPNYYSKGIEYKNKKNDFTNKIFKEEKILKKVKGRLFYTNEPVMSSSVLINKFLQSENNLRNNFLNSFKKKNKFNKIYKKFQLIKNKKILIIGDAILDEYVFTQALAKSPKEELISVKENSRKIYLGGILATAKHISNFVNKPTLLTVLGNDVKNNNYIKKDLSKTCKLALFNDNHRLNIIKTRYLDHSKKKLFQSQEVPFNDIDKKLEKKIINYLEKSLPKFDMVIINDFGHGMLTEKIRRLIEKKSKKLAINVQSNSANLGFNFFNKYKKCNYLTMDEPEARIAIKERFGNINLIKNKILNEINAKTVAITYGKNGTILFTNKNITSVPALSTNVVDTLGAGDAFFAMSSIYYLVDKNINNVAFIGNVSGAIKIQYLGHEKHINSEIFFPYLKSLLS